MWPDFVRLVLLKRKKCGIWGNTGQGGANAVFRQMLFQKTAGLKPGPLRVFGDHRKAWPVRIARHHQRHPAGIGHNKL